jgi:hypothetical protein
VNLPPDPGKKTPPGAGAAPEKDPRRRPLAVADRKERALIWLLCGIAAPVGLLAMTSIAFDFGNCAAPSRDFPFFVAGRLASGALIPFLLLYLHGLDRIFPRAQRSRPQLLILAGLVLLLIISEIKLTRPVFSSEYNWFHLVRTTAG